MMFGLLRYVDLYISLQLLDSFYMPGGNLNVNFKLVSKYSNPYIIST